MLTVIGIILAASAAFMLYFYGGDVFASGTTRAQATAIQVNAGNIQSAYEVFQLENGLPPQELSQLLVNRDYIKSTPSFGDNTRPLNSWFQSPSGGTYFLLELNDTRVCTQINDDLRRGSRILDVFSGDLGCARENDGVFFFLALEDGPPENNQSDANQEAIIP